MKLAQLQDRQQQAQGNRSTEYRRYGAGPHRAWARHRILPAPLAGPGIQRPHVELALLRGNPLTTASGESFHRFGNDAAIYRYRNIQRWQHTRSELNGNMGLGYGFDREH